MVLSHCGTSQLMVLVALLTVCVLLFLPLRLGNKATIYLYAQNNGYAVYEFTVTGVGSAVEDVESVKVETKKVVENGQVYIIKNGVKFNVLGAEVK